MYVCVNFSCTTKWVCSSLPNYFDSLAIDNIPVLSEGPHTVPNQRVISTSGQKERERERQCTSTVHIQAHTRNKRMDTWLWKCLPTIAMLLLFNHTLSQWVNIIVTPLHHSPAGSPLSWPQTHITSPNYLMYLSVLPVWLLSGLLSRVVHLQPQLVYLNLHLKHNNNSLLCRNLWNGMWRILLFVSLLPPSLLVSYPPLLPPHPPLT